VEGGLDWTTTDGLVDNAPDDSGALWKITVAPQVSLDHFFLSRPVLRAYVTYAGWSKAYRNAVGGIDYLDETSGFGFGVQMEAWW
jgi:maltoporin